MLGIKAICDTINNMFKRVRVPVPQISRLLMVCSMIKRPGLSVMTSLSNVANSLSNVGIPINSMPDGSDNMTMAFANAVLSEVYRALKYDASVQVGMQPGTMSSVGVGANAGGPVTVVSTLTNAGVGFGLIL